MKGVPGLLLAVGLGLVGAFLNWYYLAQKGQELEAVDFIGIADEVKINRGDRFTKSHFAKVSIPRNRAGSLEKSAVRWNLLPTVVGQAATRSYEPGEIVLGQDLRTRAEPDIKTLLAADERVIWIPIDTRTFVPSLVNSGDQVSFIVPRLTRAGPTPVDSPGDATARAQLGATDTIGPFRILALGNRLGSQDVMKAAGVATSQESVMGIAVKIIDGHLDARAQQLSDLLRLTNMQQVQVMLHPAQEKK